MGLYSRRRGLVLWLILQIILAALQAQEVVDVSAVAHLGGASGGLIVWTLDRLRQAGNTATPIIAPPAE